MSNLYDGNADPLVLSHVRRALDEVFSSSLGMLVTDDDVVKLFAELQKYNMNIIHSSEYSDENVQDSSLSIQTPEGTQINITINTN